MRRRWGNLLAALGLTRAGRIVFTSVALLGLALAVADAVIPRSGSEADLGPNAGAAVIVLTIGLLGLIAAADGIFRALLSAARQSADSS
jgi:preprotein translocase subunit SecE